MTFEKKTISKRVIFYILTIAILFILFMFGMLKLIIAKAYTEISDNGNDYCYYTNSGTVDVNVQNLQGDISAIIFFLNEDNKLDIDKVQYSEVNNSSFTVNGINTTTEGKETICYIGLYDDTYDFSEIKSSTSDSEYAITDKDNNKLNLKKITVVYDETQPEITDMQQAVEGNNIRFTVTAVDNISGLKEYSFDNGASWISSNQEVFSDAKKIYVKVKDKAGNISDTQEYTLDKTPPELNNVNVEGVGIGAKGNDDKDYYKSAVIKISAKDDESGLAEKAYSIDNQNWVADNNFSVSKNENYTVYVKNSKGMISSKNIDVDIISGSAKIDVIQAPNDWTNKEQIEVLFKVTYDGAGYDSDNIQAQLKYDSGYGLDENGENVCKDLDVLPQNDDIYKIIIDNSKESSYQAEITINLVNGLGMPSTNSLSINYDKNIPNISPDIDNKYKGEWTNKQIAFTMVATDEESGIKDFITTLGDTQKNISTKYIGNNKYKFIYDLEENFVFDGNITIQAYDNAGNLSEPVSMAVKIDTKNPSINSINLASDSENSKYVKSGGTVKVIIDLVDEGSGIDETQTSVSINNSEPVLLAKEDSNIYSCVVNVESLKDKTDDDTSVLWCNENDEIKITNVIIYDKAGNSCDNWTEYAPENTVKYYEQLELSDINLQYTSSDNDIFVRNNDMVYISFSATHPLNITESYINQGDKNTSLIWSKSCIHNNSDGRYYYEGYYEVENIPEADNKALNVYLTMTDDAGNVLGPLSNANLGEMVYYAPIESGFSDLKFETSNSSSNYTKNGDTVIISFKTTHPVLVDYAEICSNEIKLNSIDGMTWSGSYILKDGDIQDNNIVEYNFTLSDKAYNHSISKSQDDTTKLYYQAPIKVNNLIMVSDNEKAEYKGAKNGNIITVTFNTTHPVMITNASIAGSNVDFSSQDGMNWVAEYVVASGVTNDNEYISLYFNLNDAAGNDEKTYTQNNLNSDKVQYFAPIIITNINLYSDNQNDKTKYVKNGDTITVEFTSNHAVDITSAMVSNNIASLECGSGEGTNQNWKLTYKVSNGGLSDQSQIAFTFTANDYAENVPVVITNQSVEEINVLTYYSLIKNDVTISSQGFNKSYVKNGERVTVSGNANHGVTPQSAIIMGRSAEALGRNTDAYSIYYVITENENSIVEGNINFSYVLTDLAGNTLSINKVTDNSNVLYDRTAPVMNVEYESVSFTNHSVTYNFSFSDEYISSNDISIKINGIEYITDEERKSISGNAFTKEITLDTDNDYRIRATMKDLAGNNAEPEIAVNMTIDKTNPEINTIGISTETPEIYRSSFNIAEHFSIDDDNLKDVICTVTNSDGTNDWNINESITKDGKNTVYLLATDMADNISSSITYDFYIDGTSPKPIITDKITGKMLTIDESYNADSKTNLQVSLELLNIKGISNQDEFTKLSLINEDNGQTVDLLDGSHGNNDVYSIDISDCGNYVLCAEAQDEVGNNTGKLRYNIEISHKSMIKHFTDNKILFISSISIASIGFFAGLYMFVFKKIKGK